MPRVMTCAIVMGLMAFALGLSDGVQAQTEDVEMVRITVLYDNYLSDERLTADWGFAALVEYGEQTLLFDTGANGSILLDNMEILDIDPARIDILALSHEHADHVGGIAALFEAGAAPDLVFVLPSFSDRLKNTIASVSDVVEVEAGLEIMPGIITTGELATSPVLEQAILIDTAEGLIVMTGCAHPGIVEVVRAALELTDRPVALVLGGFHLLNTTSSQINTIIRDLRDLDVAKVAPSHCTGSLAIRLFEQDYGDDFIALGAGSVLEFANPENAVG